MRVRLVMHYHGTPVTPRSELLTLAGRCFCVSFADPRDVRVCHEIGQSVMLDNGAFTFWQGGATPDWSSYMDWAERWLVFPTTWAVIPDVIDGDVAANDALLVAWWARRMPAGQQAAPVWHLHEPLERLRRLVAGYGRVCFGSSGAYRKIGTDAWHRRVSAAFDVAADEHGRVPWIHMLRGLDVAGGGIYPFASADSSNAARNHKGSWKQRARPVAAMVANTDQWQTPGRWHRTGWQQTLIVETETREGME